MILFERTLGGRKFFLVNNSIVDEQVEAIVNPANEHLAHGGGVAGLISREGGPDIQKESTEKAPVKTGSAVYTSAGELPFKHVIHTVGPIWKGGVQDEPELLKSAVWSALELADQLGLTTLSLPAISTGIFGYPLEAAVRIIYRTICDFLESDSSLAEVHLCEFSAQKAADIKTIIEKETNVG